MRRLGRAALLAAVTLVVAAPAFALDVQYTLTGPPGDNGWFLGPVTVKWTVTGETSTSNCDTKQLTQDTTGTSITCTASDGMGGTFQKTATVKLDQSAPTKVAGAAARAPDNNGWYAAPVGITWSGSDATSGIASCTAITYSGPDTSAAAPAGTCRDRAGNTSAATTFPLAFDATPPALTDVGATVSGTTATVRWTPGADVVGATVTRQDGTPVAVAAGAREAGDGPLAPGATATWTVTVRDAAGNATSATATASVPAAQPQTAQAAKATARPVLRWRRVAEAKYYNLQVYRGTRKILTAWPTKPRYTMHRTWHFRGRTHRLAAGRYRWYVWAGYGARARHRYGKLLAHGTLTVTAAQARGPG